MGRIFIWISRNFFLRPYKKKGDENSMSKFQPYSNGFFANLALKTSSCMGSELLVKAFMVAIIYIYPIILCTLTHQCTTKDE
jgi:hypothetical protein